MQTNILNMKSLSAFLKYQTWSIILFQFILHIYISLTLQLYSNYASQKCHKQLSNYILYHISVI